MLPAEAAGFLQVHNHEVLLHVATQNLPKPSQQSLISSSRTSAIALALIATCLAAKSCVATCCCVTLRITDLSQQILSFSRPEVSFKVRDVGHTALLKPAGCYMAQANFAAQANTHNEPGTKLLLKTAWSPLTFASWDCKQGKQMSRRF